MNKLKLFTLVIILLIASASHSFSQKKRYIAPNLLHYDHKPYHFGFSIGLNKMNFALKSSEDLSALDYSLQNRTIFDTVYSVLPRHEYGFNIGIVSNLKLGQHWDLRFIPTLTFGDRNIEYYGVRNGQAIKKIQKIESTFIDIPLHLKYKSVRMGNTRAYVIGGLKYSYDLASGEEKEDYEEEVLSSIKKNDYFYELGVGFDHYFFYFKFSMEIKAAFGIRDMINRDNTIFSNSIDQLKSQIIMVSLLFE
ncbi:MAG: PorT family protein [Bacteroidetes bacterium]|nr:PorT family protein [Bacteroidota bacterium]